MADDRARETMQTLANRGSVHARFLHIQVKAIRTTGSRAMKLYLVKTARPSASPSKAAFRVVEVALAEKLSKRKSTRTNSGIVFQSVPIVAAWMIRTGKKVRKPTKAKRTKGDAKRRSM